MNRRVYTVCTPSVVRTCDLQAYTSVRVRVVVTGRYPIGDRCPYLLCRLTLWSAEAGRFVLGYSCRPAAACSGARGTPAGSRLLGRRVPPTYRSGVLTWRRCVHRLLEEQATFPGDLRDQPGGDTVSEREQVAPETHRDLVTYAFAQLSTDWCRLGHLADSDRVPPSSVALAVFVVYGTTLQRLTSGGSVDVSNWINLGVFLLTAIAVWVAIVQAREARTQRDAADSAKTAAAGYAVAALDAASRSASAAERAAGEQARAADALEQQVELARDALPVREPWLFRSSDSPNVDQRWRIENRTGEAVKRVSIRSPYIGTWVRPNEVEVGYVEPGASIGFTFVRRFSSPSEAVVTVVWTPLSGPGAMQHTQRIE
jgi:hypothetical protein